MRKSLHTILTFTMGACAAVLVHAGWQWIEVGFGLHPFIAVAAAFAAAGAAAVSQSLSTQP